MSLNLGELALKRLEFPGRAGELQRARATASLIRELGDNYGIYHRVLADRLASYGRRPEPVDFANYASYADAWTDIQEIVMAEAVLRNARDFRRSGRPLDYPHDPAVPLVSNDRLVDYEAYRP